MNRYKLPFFTSPGETCDCGRRIAGCRWLKCGQPGPREHAYKCEVFYSTAGNFIDQPARLRNIGLIIAHVLGYTEAPPHDFGTCGKIWTLSALHYRLRDGPLSSSMAILLTPRPVPASLIACIQKVSKSEKPYKPRSHRLFDANPFPGLGVSRHGVEHRLTLSHVARAVWSAHCIWLARASLGGEVDWDTWQLDHIAPPPTKLLGNEDKHSLVVARNRFSTLGLDPLGDVTADTLYQVTPTSLSPPNTFGQASPDKFGQTSPNTFGPRTPDWEGSETGHSAGHRKSPPSLDHHMRPRSFAGYADWNFPNAPVGAPTHPKTIAGFNAQHKHRMSLNALEMASSFDVANSLEMRTAGSRGDDGHGQGGSPARPFPQRLTHVHAPGVLGSPARGIMVIKPATENDSTYYLANESASDMADLRCERLPFSSRGY